MTIAPETLTSTSSLDPVLLRLVQAAERGEECPPLVLIAGGWLIQGSPVSTEAFYDVTYRVNYNELAGSPEARRLRGRPEEKERILEDATRKQLAPLGEPIGLGGAVINLLRASAYPPGAPAVNTGAMRVPLAAVASWWATGFSTDKQQTSSSVGFGFSF
ncbi:hypothetical protein [Kineococcus rhizosphaerae]|uniref:Uncharacterized protein n=1 Tax=Kineococcus rhizosphaerae TaxID=559628 RepID=A0A2T0QXI5_9ACTN|nr:hypothetical protein [Kineococcus rhizosphaerae]PRY10758.1 hypothetical protein CLV37_11522 [Kineococcus rhizosphaerae]